MLQLFSVPPKIIETNSILDYYSEDEDETQNELKVTENETTELECFVEGNPKPLILWIKDGHVLNPDIEKHYMIFHNGQLLQIHGIKPSDAGLYTCVASNIAGTKEKSFVLDIYSMDSLIFLLMVIFLNCVSTIKIVNVVCHRYVE